MKVWTCSSQIHFPLCKQEEYFKGPAALDLWDKFKDYADYNDFTIKWLAECRRGNEEGCLYLDYGFFPKHM